MPTATSIASYSLNNLGPLTTTFTPAASCASQTQDVWIVSSYTYSGSSEVEIIGEPCGATVASNGNCFPSGSAVDSEYTHHTAHPSSYWIDYFSPGLICPSGWSTIGLATKVDNGSIATTGPAFVNTLPTGESAVYTEDLFNPAGNALLEAMDAGETAILCCPSGFSANTAGIEGYCTSDLPDYPVPTAVCQNILNGSDLAFVNTTLTLLGSTYTGQVMTITGSADLLSTFTETLSSATPTSAGSTGGGSVDGDYTAVTVADVIYLIHGASDTASASSGGKSSMAATGAVGLPGVVALFTLVAAFTSGLLLMV